MAKPKLDPTEVLIADEQEAVPVVVSKAKDTKAENEEDARADKRLEDTEIGQRAINLIWENTQSRIALIVVVVGVALNAVVVWLVISYDFEISVTQLALVSICLQFVNMIAGIVIGFYFSRTNHQNRGGVGAKPENPYMGR